MHAKITATSPPRREPLPHELPSQRLDDDEPHHELPEDELDEELDDELDEELREELPPELCDRSKRSRA